MNNAVNTRRGFLKSSLALAAASKAVRAADLSRPAERHPETPTLCLFTKPLGGRAVSQLPSVLHDLNCDAVDLTCRPGGHVLPERVADDLPRAHEKFKAAGIQIPMLTTAVADASKGSAEAIFRTASSLGIQFIKLGYYLYGDLNRIEDTLRHVADKLRDLVGLARQYKLQLGFHNHSGLNVGSPVWDLQRLLEPLPSAVVGSYFDAAHATVEGGVGGWQIGLNLLAPRIIMMSVKDFGWERDAKGHWQPHWGPLGSGMVAWDRVMLRMKEARFAGPISVHVEYISSAPAGSQEEQQNLKAIAQDWNTARDLVRRCGLDPAG